MDNSDKSTSVTKWGINIPTHEEYRFRQILAQTMGITYVSLGKYRSTFIVYLTDEELTMIKLTLGDVILYDMRSDTKNEE